jgi:hypothetical protein
MADAVERLAPIYAGQGAMLQRVLRRRSSGELEVISSFLGDLVIEDDSNLSSPAVPDDAR